MRVLLDECVDERLRHRFAGHECQTARQAGISGLTNGDVPAPAGRFGSTSQREISARNQETGSLSPSRRVGVTETEAVWAVTRGHDDLVMAVAPVDCARTRAGTVSTALWAEGCAMLSAGWE